MEGGGNRGFSKQNNHLLPSVVTSEPSPTPGPTQRPRLSFDDSANTKYWKQVENLDNGQLPPPSVSSGGKNDSSVKMTRISLPTPSNAHTDPSLRRASTPGLLGPRSNSIDRPSSNSLSSHPSLQEDVCSEIVRLETENSTDIQNITPPPNGDSHKSNGLANTDSPRLRRVINVLKVSYWYGILAYVKTLTVMGRSW